VLDLDMRCSSFGVEIRQCLTVKLKLTGLPCKSGSPLERLYIVMMLRVQVKPESARTYSPLSK